QRQKLRLAYLMTWYRVLVLGPILGKRRKIEVNRQRDFRRHPVTIFFRERWFAFGEQESPLGRCSAHAFAKSAVVCDGPKCPGEKEYRIRGVHHQGACALVQLRLIRCVGRHPRIIDPLNCGVCNPNDYLLVLVANTVCCADKSTPLLVGRDPSSTEGRFLNA